MLAVALPLSTMSSHNGTELYSLLQPDDIRILVLLPGSNNDLIQCSLEYAKRGPEGGIPYEALSYMWGPPTPIKAITLDDRPMPIRENLWKGLKSLRDEVIPRRLWVDALCINQEDVGERNFQVLLMCQIYRSATRVLIWLGDAEADSDMLFDFVATTEGNFGRVGWLNSTRRRGVGVELTEDKMETVRGAFLALCGRPYWRRVWIIQEVLCASNLELVCGTKKMSWSRFSCTFGSVIDTYLFSGTEPSTPAWSILRVRKLYSFRKDYPLVELLELCSDCESICEDIRDRIYGLLGIVDKLLEITPDYLKTPLEVYLDVVQAFLSTYSLECQRRFDDYFPPPRCTELVGLIRHLHRLLGDPLWSNDLKCFLPVPEVDLLERAREIMSIPVKQGFDTQSHVIYVGRVVPPERRHKHLPAKKIQVWNSKVKIKREMLKRIQNSLSSLDERDFHRTEFIGGYYTSPTNTSHPNYSNMSPPYTHYEGGIENGRPLAHSMSSVNIDGDNRTTGLCRAFITFDGHFGIASCRVELNDRLCSFRGISDFYFIIRKEKDLSDFNLVGQAIVLVSKILDQSISSWNSSEEEGMFDMSILSYQCLRC